jgi:hypothetical protein
MGERNARSLGSAYGRLYGPIAVAAVLIASQPLIEPDVSGASTAVLRIEPLGEDPSWLDTAGDSLAAWPWPTTGFDVISLILLIGVTAGTVAATLRPACGPRIPAAVAVLSAALLLTLLVKPGTDGSGPGVGYVRHHSPGLTGAGSAALTLSLLAAGLAAAHALQVRRLARAVAPG